MSEKRHWRPTTRQVRVFAVIVGILIVIVLLLYQFSGRYQSEIEFYLSQVWFYVSVGGRFPIILGAIIIVAGILVVLIGGYRFNWQWTGFGDYTYVQKEGDKFQRGKTLWDWMQLLIIPIVLAGVALFFNQQSARTEHEIAQDNQRETALQEYIDEMSDLMLNHNLRTSQSDAEIRNIARTRTLSVLRRLDGERKGILLQFLHDSQLISVPEPIVRLDNADLSGIFLFRADLSGADLSGVNLQQSYIGWSDLKGASLVRANLRDASLHGSSLEEADLRHIYMSNTDLGSTRLQRARVDDYFQGADLTDADLRDVIRSH